MRNLPPATTGGASTTHPALSPLCEGSYPTQTGAGAERVVGERRKVFPFFQTVDHAALQILEREHRRLVVNELAHKQIAEVVDAVFALELFQIEQRTAPGERILNGDNLPPLTVRTRHASGERVMTDIDINPLAGAGAAPVE